MAASTLDSVIALSKRRGFAFASAEAYSDGRGAWDLGPHGVELKENIRRQWWRAVVQRRPDVVGLDSVILTPGSVWEASGHAGRFSDPLVECRSCRQRYRVDHLQERATGGGRLGEPCSLDVMDIPCPGCELRQTWIGPFAFPLMMSTHVGYPGEDTGCHYLRPETAQGAFLNLAALMQVSRRRPPFGVAQMGKSFRNELKPGRFLFRTREFEQLELEYFVPPKDVPEWFATWSERRSQWYLDLGMRQENLRALDRAAAALDHSAVRTCDIEYRFGFESGEWGEIEGVTHRGDADLRAHAERAGGTGEIHDPATDERYVPHVIETSAGVTRAMLAFLVDAYAEDEAPNTRGGVDSRVVLRLDPRLAPVKVAVLPLSRNAELSPRAARLADTLAEYWAVEMDDAGAIGRRYRRQDEIGTPFCVTVDFETAGDDAVTVRDRDTMHQERVGLDALEHYLGARLRGC